MSFDVVSLFTKVATGLAVQVARKRLEEDDTLSEHTALAVDEIVYLLEFCLGATFLAFWGKVYQHIHGTAMGLLVSVVVVNMAIENVEGRYGDVQQSSAVLEKIRR